MRRLHRSVFVFVAIAAAVWACGDDYQEAPAGPVTDAGADTSPRDATNVLETSVVPPSITLGTVAPIPRGESATLTISVGRGAHPGVLTVAASGLPTGVSAPAATIPTGTSETTLTINVDAKAPEGAVSIDIALLDGNEKLATSSLVLQIAPFRSGTLDPDFGTNGFVDLGVPPSLVAFASDGALYVDATSGLARWSKDGVRDPGYGPFGHLSSQTFFAMAAADNGQVYFSGYELGVNNSVPIIVRTLADGTVYDGTFGTSGVRLVPTDTTAKFATAIAFAVLPTSIAVVVKVDEDSAGRKGPLTVARLTSNGTPDATYGTGGYLTLGNDVNAAALAFVQPVGVDHFFLAAGHVDGGVPGYLVFEGANNAITARAADDGIPTALAPFDGGALVARTFADAGASLARIGDGGIDLRFPVAADEVAALSVDDASRSVAAGWRGNSATWQRHLADGGVDPGYRGGVTSELSRILATKTTDKYVYLAGTAAQAPGFLRMARLLR